MEHIVHLPEYRVVVCKTCQYAILPVEIDSHFKSKRQHRFTKEACQAVVERVKQIQGLIKDKEELRQGRFPFPDETSEPVAALGAPRVNGLRCTVHITEQACRFIGKDIKRMQEHSLTEHNWRSTNKGGRPRKSDIPKDIQDTPWRKGVRFQRFFKQGPKSGFFEVERAIAVEECSNATPKSTWEIFQGNAAQERRRIEEIEERKIQASDESREPNPWLRRTGWSMHLGGFDHVKMRDLVRPVAENEPELRAIHQAFSRLSRAAQKVAVTNVIGQPALFEVHRKEPSKKPKKPFNSRMDKTTFKQYTSVWNQLLSYIWRADDLEENDRPKYRLTSKQQAGFDRLMDMVDVVIQLPDGAPKREREEAEKRLESAILELCIALLDDQFGDNQYQSAIISGLAILGLHEGGRWANAEDYTPKLSAVIKLARLMVAYTAYNLRRHGIKGRIERGISQQEAEQKTASHSRFVQGMTRKFMMLVDNEGEPHPMDWMLDTRTYGLYIRYHTPAEGTINWKGSTVLYQQIQFDMQQLQNMVHGLVAETRRTLIQDLLLLQLDEHGDVQGEPLPPIDWANTVDNPTEQKIGWSFLNDIRNRFNSKIQGQDWLAKRVIEKSELNREFIQSTSPEGIKWRETRIDKYYRRMEQFQEQLLILMHITGGQAARAPEIISIRHRNTANGGVRNIFIDGGLVLFVTAYHKGYEYSEKAKLIQRFLPKEVGELLVYYLWLALPFFETMQLMVDGVDELSAFVWGDERSETRQEDIKDDETIEQDRENGGENNGKLTTVKLGRYGPKSASLHQVGQEEISPTGARKSARRPRSKAWTSERMRKMMQRESNARMGVKLNISAWRQVSIAIARKFIREEYRFDSKDGESDECDDFDEDNDQGDSAWDLQSGHGTRMAGLIYARLLFEGGFETQSQKEKYRQVSQEWHRFLGFPSAMEGFGINTGMKRKKSHWEAVNQEMQELRWKQMRQANVQAKLEGMLGPEARFRGKQKPAIDAIMHGHSPVMVIMGTGGGKSMLFMLPAATVSGGSTIVIVPLVALQEDLQERCEKAMISSVVWSSQTPYESASIVFVTPESAVSKTFAGFIKRLQELRQLDRIVVDECHSILDGNGQFRPKLRKLGQLVLYGAQMVYLTATLPPRDEEEFRQVMHIPRQGLEMFRDRTRRKNVRYQVQDVDIPGSSNALGWGAEKVGFDPVVHDAVLQLVQQKLEQHPSRAKMIIYCSSVVGAEGLGSMLGCEVYHRKIDSRDGKFRRLDDWRNSRDSGGFGEGRVIVSTNALGLGVDVPDIRVVIHVGKVYALKDYAQESGRAGRDGEKSEAIIIRGVGAGGDNYDDRKKPGQMDIAEFMQGSICRRVILDQVMDAPRAREGCEDGEERCDVCRRHQDSGSNDEIFDDSGIGSSSQAIAIPSSPAALPWKEYVELAKQEQQRKWVTCKITRKQRIAGTEVKELIEYMEEWCGKCTLCHWRGGRNAWHSIKDCPRDEAREIQDELQDAIKGIRYDQYSCCYYCGIPQEICNRWGQTDQEGWWKQQEDGRCQYSGVLIRAVMTMLAEGIDEAIQEVYRWIKEFGVDITDKACVYKWMGQRVEWGGYEASRLTQVFHKLAKQHRV